MASARPSKKARTRIEEELERVRRAVEALKREPRAEELEGAGDNTPLSEEMDATLAVEEKEIATDRLGRLLDRAAALDEALHRFDSGVYGICVICGRQISQRRLHALPEALRCSPCQEELEKKPAREEVRAHEWKLAEEGVRDQKTSEMSDELGIHPRPGGLP